ncbi:hypothetical protein [Rhodococcus sp. X156]|uniref:hypothetical protein n=1 Tax=Rhodococcus sp. X156 TaxID=2499145 RepID=UPI000FD92913|nr:hypothetical protein [Rhodococcus sp. X156]
MRVTATTDERGSSAAAPGVPPTLDLAQHFRDLRSVLLPALVVAVVCALLVFLGRGMAAERWEATVTARVDAPTASTSSTDTTALTTASYLALATDPAVLQQAAQATGATWPASELTSRVTVTEGDTPGLLTVTVRGDTAGQAAAVAKQVVQVFDAEARNTAAGAAAVQVRQLQERTSPLFDRLQALGPNDPARPAVEAQYQAQLAQIGQLGAVATGRLVALSAPTTSDGPVAPTPARDAALALIAVLILAAEALVLLRGRFGRTVSRPWATHAAQSTGAELIDCTAGKHSGAAVRIEMMVRRELRAGDDVLVLYCPPLVPGTEGNQAADAAEADADAAGAAAEQPSDGRGALVQLSADEPWWRSTPLEQVTLAVVVVERGARTRAVVQRTLQVLAQSQVRTVLSVVRPGRAVAEVLLATQLAAARQAPDRQDPDWQDPEGQEPDWQEPELEPARVDPRDHSEAPTQPQERVRADTDPAARARRAAARPGLSPDRGSLRW